jgi:tripartite ATP-independent transporter DctP family solute receptor
MKGWSLVFLLPIAILAYGFYAGATSTVEQAKVIRLGHVLNQQHPVHKGMQFMADDLWKRSGGKLRVEIYPDEQLGPERELIEMLQFGSLGMTKVSTGVLESFSPKITVFSLPYLFRDREHFWKVADGEIGEELLNASLPYNLKGLTYYDAGARSFYINKKSGKAIRKPEDLYGLSIRVMKSKTAVRMIEALGANPVPIPFGELYSALDTGTVDGAENNPPSLHTSKQYEVSSTYCLDEHTIIPDILIISLDTWNRLTPEEQRWVKESAHASSLYQRELWEKAEEEALAEMEKSGVKIIKDVDKEAFRNKASVMYQDAEYQSPEIQDLIKRILAIK